MPSWRSTTPLKPWTGWWAKGAVTPLNGPVPMAEPEGSLPGAKVAAGRADQPVSVARP
ncbi:hypothetical protein ACFZDK_21095 [Streptomyces sp. NPDC007901]|uniref:hypothetical protein n=1 Tax=Streptomyces sp. NPDC007901 TaxID=3364785 RepID=UPI0036E093EC